MQVARSLTVSWESFQVGRTLSLSPNAHKPRPKEESMEPISCYLVKGICGSGLEWAIGEKGLQVFPGFIANELFSLAYNYKGTTTGGLQPQL